MYAMTTQARRVQAACDGIEEGHIILVGNETKELDRIKRVYSDLMGEGWKVYPIRLDVENGLENYKENAQLLIAQMRTAAFCAARALKADYLWSLDSDVLPTHNSLKCMLWSLQFDDGFYSIATCTYPSQGGGGFLGGRGNYHAAILPDQYEDERVIPEEFKKELDENRAALTKAHEEKKEEVIKELSEKANKMHEKIKEFPPKDNVFGLQSESIKSGKGFRKRGWIDHAYPALGLGAMAPSDWCGFGCTLMNKKALVLANFDGYDGKGTEDLYICWHRWNPAGLRINVLLHCPCDHVIRNPGKEGQFVHLQCYHEPEGESIGHLRLRRRPFYSMDAGEKFKIENDGKLIPKPKKEDASIDALKIVDKALKAK